MKRTLRTSVLTVLTAVVILLGMGAQPAAAVWHGGDASEPYPFLGAYRTQYPVPPGAGGTGCGVSVLAADWGITAAHCLKNNDASAGSPVGWSVRLGATDVSHGGEDVAVRRFFRLTTERPFGRDLMLLQFAQPTTATPIPLAEDVPTPGTPVRFLGWGSTCSPLTNEPSCYPTKLQQGDGEVVPIADCPSSDPADGEICVRGRDGAQTGNADSGGPLLVKQAGEWRLAGILSGPETQGTDIAGLFTAVARHTEWIASTMRSADQIADGDSGDPLAGYPALGGCAASFVESTSSRPSDPAMLLTNAHCLPVVSDALSRPSVGEYVSDVTVPLVAVTVIDGGGYPRTTTNVTRLLYATMTGTDVAVFTVDKTYSSLRAEGAVVLRLGADGPRPGDVVSLRGDATFDCTVEAVVPTLEESGYVMRDAIRYRQDEECAPYAGLSGAALVAGDGRTVVGVHNTHNVDGDMCTEDNPCEVGADGERTALAGRAYGQQVSALNACLAPGSILALGTRECRLRGGRADATGDAASVRALVLGGAGAAVVVVAVLVVLRRRRQASPTPCEIVAGEHPTR